MNFLDILEKLENILKKEKELDYYIINNIYGKNLILLESDKYSKDELLKIKVKLENKFKNAIQDVIFKDNRLASEIKNICPKNSIIHRNISYSAWNKNEINSNKNKTVKNVIAGYSFKGGMGRSSTLAYLSYFYSLIGKKVVLLDCDFEAPGVSSMFFKKEEREETAGILDYLIDYNIDSNILLNDYFLEKNNQKNGTLYIFPSGNDYNSKEYINKISKIDFNSLDYVERMKVLIKNINNTLKPDFIFIDLRAGINESNGVILKNISYNNLLFFNNEEQSRDGLTFVLNLFENMDNNFIMNSSIRVTNSELRKLKENQLSNFLNEEFNNIKDENIINLPYNFILLENNIDEFDNFVKKEAKFYLKVENKNIYLDTIINRLIE